MNVIIVEDESAAYANIINLLSRVEPNAQILAHFDSVADTVSWFQKNPCPDLIFMDIELADGSSFNIFECITINTPIVFTTAFDQYAIKAFEVNSIDYLLKPITEDAMRHAIEKYRIQCQSTPIKDPFLWQSTEFIKRVLIPYRDKIIPIKVNDIAYFYNTDGHTSVLTLDGKCYPIRKSLDTLMSRLPPTIFFRANRQFILSKDIIESFSVWGDGRLHIQTSLPTEEPILIAKNKALNFKLWLTED